MKKRAERIVTCIVCPVGCKATVTIENGKAINIEDVECPRGEEYVAREIEAPARDFFTTIRIRHARTKVLPVRATQPVPKDRIWDCVSVLASYTVDAPVKAGDVIARNLLGLGTDIVASRDMKSAKRKEHK